MNILNYKITNKYIERTHSVKNIKSLYICISTMSIHEKSKHIFNFKGSCKMTTFMHIHQI